MLDDHERAKNLAAAFQSIVLPLAIALGGVWALFEFKATRKYEIAEATLANISPRMSSNMKYEQVGSLSDSDILIEVTVVFENHGLEGTVISWIGASPLRVQEVTLKNGRHFPLGDGDSYNLYVASDKKDPYYRVEEKRVDAGDTDSMPFLTLMKKDRIYLVSFVAEAAFEVVDESLSDGVRIADKSVPWVVSDYVNLNSLTGPSFRSLDLQ